MNQKKPSREKTKFSKLRLRTSSAKSYKVCSPRPQEKISSYFSSALIQTESTSNETEATTHVENTSDIEPNVVRKVRSEQSVLSITTSKSCIDIDTLDDSNEFTIPKLLNIKTKIKSKCRIENFTKEKPQIVSKTKVANFDRDTNQEHLQLAIAMSRSIMDVENPQEAECEENTFPSTQQKIMKVKQTLDQFGFKSERGSIQVNSKPNVKVMKGKKIKYCTPTLFLRTEEDRTKIIENKVSQIINNISIYNSTTQEKNVDNTKKVENKPRSFILRDYYKENPRLFSTNSLYLPNSKDNVFYNGIVAPSNVQAGLLLKDWSTIPGRESPPPLNETMSVNEIETEPMDISQVVVATSTEISMSPELFADSDEDCTIEQNERNNCFSKEFISSTNLVTHITIDNITESDGSTKSISLLDNHIKGKHNKNTLVHVNMPKSHTDSSLSPFPTLENHLNNTTTKPIKSKYNFQENNNENSDSLSPFEPVHVPTSKSPKRKVTPKKKTPSPKKYVVTPKSRKLVSFDNQKRNSPCKRSILFTDKQDAEKMHNNGNKSSEICHFESFCNDSIECFDLTHSSDDEIFKLDYDSTNGDKTNKSITVTQLINELYSEKCELNNDENESFEDSQTIKLNESKCVESDLNGEFSPEFDCLNISNNKIFYETLNNSPELKNDGNIISLETSKNEILNILDDEIVSENTLCANEKNQDREVTSTPNLLKTPVSNENLRFSFSSPNSRADKNRNRLLLRRSYSENFIDNKMNRQESSSLGQSPRLSLENKTLRLSNNEIERNDLMECNENIILSQSSISTCSDISDEELNYSCNSIYRRYNLSDRVISIPDDAVDKNLTSAMETEIETTTKHSSNIHESNNYLSNVSKSIQHPRLLKLSTPIKLNESNHSNNKEENSIDETDSTRKTATPKTEIIINRENITPKGHYSEMDTPEVNRQLEKYGLKSMKRNKGVKILHYIYESTHPYENESNDCKTVNSSSDDEIGKATKRRKTKSNEIYNEELTVMRSEDIFLFGHTEQNENQIADSEKVENMIFERTQSMKISSCRVPLHVAWYNLLSNSKELLETILTYTPVQVEEIYKQFKNLGYKFHVQDIIAFLDKKCITIKIAQNNRNQRK